MYDLIVVGGGPAGMTTALYARRNGKTVLVIEKNGFGGQITHSPRVENYPGTMVMSGNEFADRMLEQILAQGAEIELETVASVQDEGAEKVVRTEEGGEYRARSIVLAAGVRHRLPGLPGEEELIGEGISFCAVCDGDFYAGQRVCVVGGGNSALQEALLLAQICREVVIVQDLPELTGEASLQAELQGCRNVRVLTGCALRGYLTEGGAFRGLEVAMRESGEIRRIEADGVFVAIGLVPENDAFSNVAALDAKGYFDSDEACRTRTPGVFVAGDCRKKGVRQLTTAVADGATAALAACRYLNSRG